ncbi:MAG: type I DNA topoisomerase [Simkaniaceae bacterium]
MAKTLIIVESPTKIKTLKKFLKGNYSFASSVGHVRDLPKKGFGIDVEHDFEPVYQILPDKKEVIAALKKAAKEADTIYLSPDPDREGEAIAWHITQILPQTKPIFRVTFQAITKDAVVEALKHPRDIDMGLVNAQQARRLLDRIVGYKISPLLQRRVQKGRDGIVSAGRVQSVALMLVVHREKEIEAFVPAEYWTISAELEAEGKKFRANAHLVEGKKVEKENPDNKENICTIPNEETAKSLVRKLLNAAYTVAKVDKREKRRFPVPPFITSTLQQEASRHFGFSAAKTMNLAQNLYEGVDLGSEGAEGLITYMRTDSVRVEKEAIQQARAYITSHFDRDYLPDKAKEYTSKKASQDAHEAIRPANVFRTPEMVEPYLDRDQFRLYQLIWRRFVASQMNPAVYDTVSCDIQTDQDIILRASGSIMKFPGFLAIYEEKIDIGNEEEKQQNLLPPLEEGQVLKRIDVHAAQSFTKPPPRFSEASLVKELEKSGIGRPSTYASIMNKIISRAYTTKEKGQLRPTELGKVIVQMLEDNFHMIMDVDFTAKMEDELEEIARNDKDWKNFIKDFWTDFIPLVEKAEETAHVPKIDTDIDCPKCGAKLQKVWSRNKYFYGCSNYPECDFTASLESLTFKKEDYAEDFDWDQKCPKCGAAMTIRHGRYGAFLGCTKYPECKGIVNIPKKGELPPEKMPDCPAIGCDGKLQQRRSRFGKIFFSCSNYPDCDVIVNDLKDLPEKYQNHPKTPYVKKTKAKTAAKKKTSKAKTKTKAKRSAPLMKVSPELESIVGAKEMSRGDVTKKLWEYIKEKNLQNPENKREIIPDSRLAKVIGEKPIDMMKLAGKLKDHLSKP